MTQEIENQTPSPESNQRRQALLAAVGLAAGLAGAAWAWQKYQARPATDPAVKLFWQQVFERPEGGNLSLQKFRGKPLLVNFWATWCPPCIEELPLLDAFFLEKDAKFVQVVGLAIDQPSAVRRFLSQHPVHFPNGLAGLGGTELGKSLGNTESVLPFSIIFDADGGILRQKLGKLTEDDLKSWRQSLA